MCPVVVPNVIIPPPTHPPTPPPIPYPPCVCAGTNDEVRDDECVMKWWWSSKKCKLLTAANADVSLNNQQRILCVGKLKHLCVWFWLLNISIYTPFFSLCMIKKFLPWAKHPIVAHHWGWRLGKSKCIYIYIENKNRSFIIRIYVPVLRVSGPPNGMVPK